MSSEDEYDYMSEDFLSKCVGKDDIRPGLINSRVSKRKVNMDSKKRNADETYKKKMKSIQEIQEENLKHGLETPLDSSNKGFALMQKMGYKSGMSLGKEGTGIVEPVGVVLKSNRIGLGWQQLLQEKKKRLEERKKKRSQRVEMDPAEYRMHMSNLHNQKLIEGDLRKSRKACYELDFKEGIESPPEFWFWPEHTWNTEDEEDEEDEEEEIALEKSDFGAATETVSKTKELSEAFEQREQLVIITSYLRSTYLYCIWCCIEFEDNDDLGKNCPGPTRPDHDD